MFLFQFIYGRKARWKENSRFGHRLEDNIKTGIEEMVVCALTRNSSSYLGLLKPAVHVRGICCVICSTTRGITLMQLVCLMTLSITEGYVESNGGISSE